MRQRLHLFPVTAICKLSRQLYPGCRVASYQISPLISVMGTYVITHFRHRFLPYEASSLVHFHSALFTSTCKAHRPRFSLSLSTTWFPAVATSSGLKTPSDPAFSEVQFIVYTGMVGWFHSLEHRTMFSFLFNAFHLS